jgi:hypothetical protein
MAVATMSAALFREGACQSVGTFDSHEEAVAVRNKLDMMNDNDDVIEQPTP